MRVRELLTAMGLTIPIRQTAYFLGHPLRRTGMQHGSSAAGAVPMLPSGGGREDVETAQFQLRTLA